MEVQGEVQYWTVEQAEALPVWPPEGHVRVLKAIDIPLGASLRNPQVTTQGEAAAQRRDQQGQPF